jgi:hypothetical protein
MAAAALGRQHAAILSAAGNRSQLGRRIERLLDGRHSHPIAMPRGVTMIVLAAATMIVADTIRLASAAHPLDAISPITRQSLLARASELRSGIGSLSITTSHPFLLAGKPLVRQSLAIVKGNRMYRRDTVRPASVDGNGQTETEWFFDGSRTVTHRVAKPSQHQGRMVLATIENGMPASMNLGHDGFYALNPLLSAKVPFARWGQGLTLTGLLENPRVVVHPSAVMFAGRRSALIEIPGSYRAWLDLQRGLIPLQQECFNRSKLEIRYTVDQVVQFDGGVWVAVRGHCESFREFINGAAISPKVVTGQIEVDSDPNGAPAVRINQAVTDDDFDIHRSLPRGTEIFDLQSEQFTFAGGGRYPDWILPSWGPVTNGMRGRVRLIEDDASGQIFSEVQAAGGTAFSWGAEFDVELDGVWYPRPASLNRGGGTPIGGDGGAFESGFGPVRIAKLLFDASSNAVPLAAGRHTVRLRIALHHDAQDSNSFFVTTLPIEITFDPQARPPAQPAWHD